MKVALILAELPDWKLSPYKASDSYPIGLMYLASYALKCARVPSLDVAIFRDLNDLVGYRPDLVGISAFTSGFRMIAPIAARVKTELGVPVVLGGAHVTALPASMPAECNVGVIGEGEETFRELLEAAAAGPLEPSVLARIRGVAYRENGRLVQTPPRPFIEDLDSIPIPDRALAAGQWPMTGNYEQMITSRGCPYDCNFCIVHCTLGSNPRFHSPERVVREIAYLRDRCNPEMIKIWDELFTLSKDRARAMLRAMEDLGLNREIGFAANSRANLIDAEWCEILKRIGFQVVGLGIESLSDQVLRFYHKTGISVETSLRAVETVHQSGLGLAGCFMIGAPGETREDMLRLFHFILDNYDKFYGIIVNRLRVYPGTKLWDYAKGRGLINEETLDGIAPREGEDTFLNNREFVLRDYVYLNEENIPREEFAFYCDMFDKFLEAMPRNYERNRRLQLAESELARLRGMERSSLYRLVGGRLKSRLRQLLARPPAPVAPGEPPWKGIDAYFRECKADDPRSTSGR